MKLHWSPQLSGAAQGNTRAVQNMCVYPHPVQPKPKKDVFANCEVAEDKPSDCEDEIQDGAEFVASDKQEHFGFKNNSNAECSFSQSVPSGHQDAVLDQYC